MRNRNWWSIGVLFLCIFLQAGPVYAAGSGLVNQGGQWIFVRNGVYDSSVNGLVLYDGAWFFLSNGILDTSLNGFVDYDNAKFYVANGQVCSNYSGLVLNEGAWYFVADGKFQNDYSGFAKYQNEWFVLKNGFLDTNYSGLFEYDGGRFLIAAGRFLNTYTGLFQGADYWYFIVNGQVQTSYSGLVFYDNAWFVLSDGILDTSYTGLYNYDGSSFLVGAGKVLSEYSGNYELGDNRYLIAGGQVINVIPYTHTESEIRAFYQARPFNTSQAITYAAMPSLNNNTPGFLSMTSLQDGLNAINFIRYVAGIPHDVTLKEQYSKYTQDATFVLAKNNTGLTHHPSNTGNSPSTLYESGAQGASSSNLGLGYTNISDSIIHGYMDDGDSNNIDRVGHRRWILSPKLANTGFGYCNGYTATYVFDKGNQDYSIDYVAWPTENTPVEVFSGPWSLHLSYAKYSDLTGVQVTMTDTATGRQQITL